MPFVKGQSGCPAGRPKGVKNRKTIFMQKLEAGGTVDSLVAALKEGLAERDPTCLALLVNRIEPALKSVSQTVEFELDTSKPLADQAAQVVKAMAEGHIGPDVVSQIMDTLDRLAGIRQVDELAARIAALEAKG